MSDCDARKTKGEKESVALKECQGRSRQVSVVNQIS